MPLHAFGPVPLDGNMVRVLVPEGAICQQHRLEKLSHAPPVLLHANPRASSHLAWLFPTSNLPFALKRVMLAHGSI